MSKFDYINRDLAKFREEQDKPEWRIRKSASMLGDARNIGKKRTAEMKKAQGILKEGNNFRKNSLHSGEKMIEVNSKTIGFALELRHIFNITPSEAYGYTTIKKKRRLYAIKKGRMFVQNYPNPKGLFFMLLEDYEKHIEKFSEEPKPYFEYPQYRELSTGRIGDTTYMRKYWPEFSTYYADRSYVEGTKYINNPFPKGVEFRSVSIKKGIRKYMIVEEQVKEVKLVSGSKPGKPFHQIDKKGNIIATWNTVDECHNATGISRGGISNVLNGWAKRSGGFTFKKIID